MGVYLYEEEMLLGLISGLISGVPSVLLSIASYVLSSMALHTIAKRRGLNKPWLAWVPVVNCWILGSLSDQYRYIVKGENKSKRKILLTLKILAACLSLVLIVSVVMMAINAAGTIMRRGNDAAILSAILGPMMGLAGLSLPIAGIAIACAVVRWMALYDVYKSLDPGNCVLFLVLSILFGITEPFFLFFNRNKDLGMPPRRSVYSEPAWQSPVQEPWENGESKDYL